MEIGQAIGRANGLVGGKPRAMRDMVKAFRRPPGRPLPVRLPDRNGGFPRLSGCPSFQTARAASDVPQRYATRSWPKASGNRLYGSLSTRFGISVAERAKVPQGSDRREGKKPCPRARAARGALDAPKWGLSKPLSAPPAPISIGQIYIKCELKGTVPYFSPYFSLIFPICSRAAPCGRSAWPRSCRRGW